MIISVNQPYFFPHIGYYQMINASDIFISYDNVSYSNHKWINSNFLIDNNNPIIISMELVKKSSNKKICDLKINKKTNRYSKNYKTFKYHYGKYKQFGSIIEIIETCFQQDKISDYNFESIKLILDYLNIKKTLIKSSDIDDKIFLGNKNEKLFNLLKNFNGKTYLNLINGQKIYSRKDFEEQNLNIFFVKNLSEYKSSFLHLLFTRERDEIIEELNKFELV